MTVWNSVPLSRVANIIMGQSPDSRFYNAEGQGVPFLQGCAQFGQTHPATNVYCSQPTKRAPKGATLFSVRAPVGAINTADQPYCIGRGVAAIVARDMDNVYLRYYLHSLSGEFERLSQGSTFSAINSTALGNILVKRPSTQREQAKIAEVLAATDHAIAQTENLIAKYRRVKTGMMQDLLTRGVNERGQLRDPAQWEDASRIGTFLYPEWSVKPLCQVATIASGVTLGRDVSGPDAVTLPYLRVFNVQDGYVDLSDVKTITIRKTEIARFKLETGDVLMNEGGDFDKLGRGAVWAGQIEPCLHQNHVFRVRTDNSQLLPDFLALVSASPYGRRFFVLNSKQSTNLASINSTQLKAFPIPCPSVEEQHRILSILAAHEGVLNNEQTRLTKLNRVKRGLMQDLLTGRVPITPLLDNVNVDDASIQTVSANAVTGVEVTV